MRARPPAADGDNRQTRVDRALAARCADVGLQRMRQCAARSLRVRRSGDVYMGGTIYTAC